MSAASHEFRGSVDFNQFELRNATFQRLLTPPIGPVNGQIYYSSSLDIPFYWNSTTWNPFGIRPVHKRYVNQAAMLADQAGQLLGYIYYNIALNIYYEKLVTNTGLIADYNPIGGGGTFYTHPAKTWVDKTALSGAVVISNLTIDSLGHPTDWVTRTLTLADLGAEASFSKGDLVQGTGISLTGTLVGRLVGTGNITIASSITQYTDTLARTAISLTTTGSSGASTYTSGTGVFNIPNYTLAGLGGEPSFTKGSLIQGTGVTLSGTLIGRLVGTGDITISSATVSVATSTVAGIVELFSDTVQTEASNAVTTTVSRTYGVQLNASGQMVINVPWVDTDTVYTHPAKTWVDKTALSGAVVISNLTINATGHPTDWVTRTLTLADLGYTGATNADNYGSWLIAASGSAGTGTVASGNTVSINGGANITVTRSLNAITITGTDTNTTYSAGTGMSLSSTTFNNTDLGSSQAIFKNINNGAGAWQFQAGSNNDSLSFAGSGATSVSFDAGNKRITFSSTDTNTTYSNGTGIDLTGTVFSHNDTSTLLGAQGGSGIASITVDGFGHVTAVSTATYLTSNAHTHGVANSGGTQQFTFGINENIRFNGTGATSVSFDAGTKTVTFNSTDTNNTYTAGTGLTLNGGSQFVHNNGNLGAALYGGSGISSITLDSLGHVSAIGTATYVTSSASTNYIPKMSSSSSVSNSLMYEDGTNSRIGVFTASPAFAFHILRTTNANLEFVVENTEVSKFATNNVLAFESGVRRIGASLAAFGGTYPNTVTDGITPRWSGRSGIYINNQLSGQTEANRTFNVWIGARTIINSLRTGETAIGPNDPAAWLDVQGTLRVGTVNSATGNVLTLGGSNIISSQTPAQIVASGGGLTSTPTLQSVTNVGNGTTTSMGIGVSSPSSQLHVNGGSGITVTASTSGPPNAIDGIHVNFESQVGRIYALQNNIAWRILETNSAAFHVVTQGSTRMIVGGNGNVLIGTSTDSGDMLRVNGSILTDSTYKSAAPSGSSAQPWKLGAVNYIGSDQSSTHNVIVEIGGTVYKLLAIV